MKCPHCEYAYDHFKDDKSVPQKGKEGNFYTINDIIAERRTKDGNKIEDAKRLYACPKCKIVFMD